jgi:hypothetical protein
MIAEQLEVEHKLLQLKVKVYYKGQPETISL